MNTEPVLSVDRLTTAFQVGTHWREVVRDVSFAIAPRETVAIVGESGSGKSVTALSIMRLLPGPRTRITGSVKLGGRNLLALSHKEMMAVRGNAIAMIFQEPMTSLNPLMTIGFQIAETLIANNGLARAAAEAEVVRLLDRVRIPDARSRFHDYPHRFSGGMRQRVMIAMALACKPSLLIADEPTTALDVTIQAQILALLKSLQDEEGMAILFITHDMGVVAEIADRMVVMYRGQAVEAGETARIFAGATHPYTHALLAAVPRLGDMRGHHLPRKFPLVDIATGATRAPGEIAETVVAGERPIIEVGHLKTRFDIRSGLFGKVSARVHAVEDISFSLHAGETLALVGESGCGKSTTGRSIARLVEPSSGSILVNGQDVMGLDAAGLREMRKHVQMIFQDPFASLNPRIRVGDAIGEPVVALGLGSAAQARERVADLLRRVGLQPDMASRFPHEFSGGQRQRICIARALAANPKAIIADEAVSGLDVSVKAQVINLLLDLQESLRLAYLFISHDMAVVERISHRVAVMYLGEIVEIGPRAAIFENPQHPYTQRLLAAVPVPDPRARWSKRRLVAEEVESPLRAAGYEPPPRQYRQVSAGHYVHA
jgi:peptide/nickel transport system ATP-binding protein